MRRPMAERLTLLGVALVTATVERTALADPTGVAPGAGAGAESEPTRADDDVLVRGQQAGGFVSRARIEDSPREITDAASLVEPLPGVHVRRLGADDSFATLSIRGSTSTQVAVYLAGVPLSGGADPTLDLATLPLWPGARATVHRTFAPAALGRGSLGGTLVIDPPSPRSGGLPRTEVWTAAGAYGSTRLRLGDVRGDANGVRVSTGLSASRSDDDFTYLDANATSGAGSDVYTTRKNAGHAAVAGLAAVTIPVRSGATSGALTITSLAQARRQELPGSASVTSGYQQLESSRLVSALELTLPTGERARSGTFVVRGWARRDGLALRDTPIASLRVAPSSPIATDDMIVAAGASTGWRARPTEATSLEIRMDGSAERFAPGTWVSGTMPAGAFRTNAGLGIDASARALGPFTLAGSARADTWFDSSADGSSSSEVRPTGNLGIEVPVGPVALASHAGFVARPASFVERFGNRGAFIGEEPGKPPLKPESAFTVDAGGRIVRRLGPVSVQLEASGFATWADDLITFVRVGAFGYLLSTNIGRARLLGIEGSARASAFGFDARVSHTALTTENQSECKFVDRRCERPPLQGRPAHDFVADLSWTRGPLRLRYGVDFVSGIAIDARGEMSVPARALHGAGARLSIPSVPGLSVAFDIRNLFDLRVAEYPGIAGPTRAPIGDLYDYPLPGRRWLVSLRFAVGDAEAPAARAQAR